MIVAFHAEGRRSGKDTAGEFVREWAELRGLSYLRIAFADKMKLLVAETLGIQGTDEERVVAIDAFKLGGRVLWWREPPYEEPDDAISGREFIINLAGDSDTDGARGLFGANFWVDQALPPTGNQFGADVIAITDLRFEVEAQRVRQLGGVVVKIERNDVEGGRSEQGISPNLIDVRIDNNGTLEEFRVRIYSLMTAQLNFEDNNA